MSLPFSSTTNKNGVIQGIERTLFGDDGDGRITGNTLLFARFTSEVNLALDKAQFIAIENSGTWQHDDKNHLSNTNNKSPIMTIDLVDGQREYAFTTDDDTTLILDIQKVLVADSAGLFREVLPVDVQSEPGNESFWDGNLTEGIPYRYDKTGNRIFLDPIPNYNRTDGLKLYYSRESNYFTTADTTKTAGIPGIFHEYLVLRPSYNYARNNGMAITAALKQDVLEMEMNLANYYGNREKDKRKVMRPRMTEYR